MPRTPRVFCAVAQVRTVQPWTPTAAKDFRSAWMPAPPPESLPAIVRTLGTRGIGSPHPKASLKRAGVPRQEGDTSKSPWGGLRGMAGCRLLLRAAALLALPFAAPGGVGLPPVAVFRVGPPQGPGTTT